MTKKQLLFLIGFILIVVSIPATLYLVRKPQIFAPKAAFIPKIEFVDDSGQVITETANPVVKLKITKEAPTLSPTPTPTPTPTSSPTQPAGGGTYQVKVWLIAYYPTGNFYNAVGGDPAAYTKNILLPAMNEASKYHGYKNPQATPALNYTITDDNIVVENNPHTYISGEAGYQEIFTKYNLCTLAKQKDIKAMIVWGDGSTTSGYSGVQWESAITGNKGILTNGGVYPQLCPDKTIVIYSLNYTRGLDAALESYGHHLEWVFGQFRTEYFGWADRDSCGNDHNPPNSRFEYDRSNTDPFQSDCRNWKPDGTGQRETLNCNIWACDGAPWLKWWMQNMPGIGNTLVGVSGVRIPNWWVYIGDPDNCYNNALGCSGL